ncbi:MAG: cytochrome c [Chitinophagaceae bacterium]|nr:cytochrome c [Chitinophagaceae bacterium]MCW5906191.1 cytochrome c [Chitinophagaceae bacterium]
MKKLSFIVCFAITIIVVSCSSSIKRSPNNAYMPDMAYSRAYETYADHSNLQKEGINYTNTPVAGTIARGEEFPFPYTHDAIGDTTNYSASRAAKNPFDSLSAADFKEVERLYLVNCGICHGKDLDGNGPLWKDGSGPYPAAPKNLMTLHMPDGQMFYSITYGKGQMGSYASQLNRKERWQVITYIKEKQKEQAAN